MRIGTRGGVVLDHRNYTTVSCIYGFAFHIGSTLQRYLELMSALNIGAREGDVLDRRDYTTLPCI